MNIFKALFGGKEENPEEKKRQEEARQFDVLKYDGVRALRMGQSAYAVQCFTHALDLKDDLECHDYLSQALISCNELPQAYEQLLKLAEADSDNQQIFLRMAQVAFLMENYGAMGDACEKAMLIDDKNPVVYYLYARACRGQGDDTNAVAMLTKAINMKEDYGEAYLLRGEIYLALGELDNASADAAYLDEHAEENEDVMLLGARIKMAQKKYDAAKSAYDRIIDHNPFCAVAFRERSSVKAQLGDNEGSEQDMRTAEEIDPQSDESRTAMSQNVENNVKQIYKNNDPYGVFSN
ncbi:MAG: tetratricopeptide repeat protein [Prevotella sp.]